MSRLRALATKRTRRTAALLPWRPAALPRHLDTSTGLATQAEALAFIVFLKESLARVTHMHLGTPDPCPCCTTMYVIERLERQIGRYQEPTDRKTAADQTGHPYAEAR